MMDMPRRQVLQAALALPGLRSAAAQAAAPPRLATETGAPAEAIAACLAQQVDAQEILGAVACVTDRYGSRTAVAGQSGDGRMLDGESVFEVGSITKVFTALLMAEMAGRGEVAVTDTLAKYLPPELRPREYDGKPITLLDLATHTSGLPRLPGNFWPGGPNEPVCRLHRRPSV